MTMENGSQLPEQFKIADENNVAAAQRRRLRLHTDFLRLAEQMDPHFGEPESEPTRQEKFLDRIASYGVGQTSEEAWSRTLAKNKEDYKPAEPRDVTEYLSYVRLNSKRVVDQGTVDEELIAQLGLSENYIDELREIFAYAAPDSPTVSVLQLPEFQKKMHDFEKLTFKKLFTEYVLEIHGVQHVFDQDDCNEWMALYKLVEDLCSPYLRDYSARLRQKAANGSHTMILDVYDTIADIEDRRSQDIEMALEAVDASDAEKQALLDSIPNETRRNRIAQFFIDHAALNRPEDN